MKMVRLSRPKRSTGRSRRGRHPGRSAGSNSASNPTSIQQNTPRSSQPSDEKYTAEQKKTVVRYLWQVAFSDSRFVASEEYLVRKIADLLHVPLADFLEAKIVARDAFR